MDIFKIYRFFWDYAFANPEKIKPTHVAIFSFAVEHCNRLGWKQKFGFPTSMVMEATGIKSYSVFKKHFDDLIEYELIQIIEFSKNQYSSNIIALKENYKANDKALDKALIKHMTKQHESTGESISSINKQETNNPLINKYKSFGQFYANQIALSNENEKYLIFVKYLYGDNPIKTKMEGVLSIRDQLTFENFQSLLDVCEKNNTSIRDIILKIENDKKYYKDKKVLYTTMLNWAKQRFIK